MPMTTVPMPATPVAEIVRKSAVAGDQCIAGTGVGDRPVMTGRIAAELAAVRRLVTIAHPFADGDAIGSQLALANFVTARGGRAVTLNFDPIPAPLAWLPGLMTVADRLPDDFSPDLVVLCETTDPARMGDRTRFFSCAPRSILIDHHPGVRPQATLNLLDPTASSTCELLFEILSRLQDPLPIEVLTCLYVGLMTDTGNFRFANATPRAHEVAARMIAAGVEIAAIHRRVYESNRIPRIRLHGLVMHRLAPRLDGRVVRSFIRAADFGELEATVTDSDGAVNQLCTATGIEAALLLRELGDGQVKASLRSVGVVDVQQVARRFGGGGHAQAASATLSGPLEAVEATVLAALAEVLPPR